MSLPAGESTSMNPGPARPVPGAVGPAVAGVFVAYGLAAVAVGVGLGYFTLGALAALITAPLAAAAVVSAILGAWAASSRLRRARARGRKDPAGVTSALTVGLVAQILPALVLLAPYYNQWILGTWLQAALHGVLFLSVVLCTLRRFLKG